MKLELTITKYFGLGYRKLNLTKATNYVVQVGHFEFRLIRFTVTPKPGFVPVLNIIPMLTILESNPVRMSEMRENNLARM